MSKLPILAVLFSLVCPFTHAAEVIIPDRFSERCADLPALVTKVEKDMQGFFPGVSPVFDVIVEETEDDTGSHAYQEPKISHVFISDKLCGSSRLESSLRHEMTHVLSYWKMGRDRYIASPIWYREGLAVLLSGQWKTEFTEAERQKARNSINVPIPNHRLLFEEYGRAAALVEFLSSSEAGIPLTESVR